jgi:hydroxypyruvate isomerase
MNRRTFARILSGAAGLIASVQKAAPQGAGLPFKLSIMGSTLGANLKPDVLVGMVADAGYEGVELNGEFQQWSDDEIRQFNQMKRSRGIVCDCIVNRPGPGGAGIVGAADPRAGETFPKNAMELIEAAKKVEGTGVIIRAGARVLNFSRETQHDTCIDNLKKMGDVAAKEGVALLLENGDREENAASYLTSAAEGIEIVKRVAHPNVKMLYDFFHAQIEEGGLIKKLDKGNIDVIGTLHVADNPGRHEPGTGEINYANIVKALVQNGFKGWMAMEYRPLKDPMQSVRESRAMVLQAAKQG